MHGSATWSMPVNGSQSYSGDSMELDRKRPRQEGMVVPVGLGRRGEAEFHCGNRRCREPFKLPKRLRNPLRSLTCQRCGARNVVRKPSRFLRCRSCKTLHETKRRLKTCPQCGSPKFEVVTNNEFYRQKAIKFHEATKIPWRGGRGVRPVGG